MLHGELLSFIAEIKDKRTIFRQDNASIHTTVTTKRVVPVFRNTIIIMASIETLT